MRYRFGLWVTVLLITVVPTAASADDVKGAEAILCTSVQATVCYLEGDCEIGTPWNWNIPQFIEIDFGQKVYARPRPVERIARHPSRTSSGRRG